MAKASRSENSPEDEPYGGLTAEEFPKPNPEPVEMVNSKGQCAARGGTPCDHYYAMGECGHSRKGNK